MKLAKGVDARHPISADDIDQARDRLIQTWEAFTIVEVSQELVEAAGRFADGFALRGYDSVQLAAAHQLHATTKQSLTFASYDRRLNQAAQLLQLEVLG
jgi:predicted nucleic acid-binding protein